MDDEVAALSGSGLLQNSGSSSSTDIFLGERLRNCEAGTQTHTCNTPGPDAPHTRTCYHTHSHVVPSSEEPDIQEDPQTSCRRVKRPNGNRVAVRKYREKEKAYAGFLEEEVKKLRIENQLLIRKVQKEAILKAEILRLRDLLLGLRGKIDTEMRLVTMSRAVNRSGRRNTNPS